MNLLAIQTSLSTLPLHIVNPLFPLGFLSFFLLMLLTFLYEYFSIRFIRFNFHNDVFNSYRIASVYSVK